MPEFFAKDAPGIDGAKKNKGDIPAEGTKKMDIAPSKGTIPTVKEVGKKPPVSPKGTTPLIEGVAITQEEATPLIEGASLRRLRRGPAEKPIETAAQPSDVEDPSLRANAPALIAPSSAKGLIKSWVIPEYRAVEGSLSREMVTTLEAQYITLVSIITLITSPLYIVFIF